MEGCEIPPIRAEFLELLGEGAFGKVHKATLKDGMEYFEDERDWASRSRKQKIIAVKELFGEFKCGNLKRFCLSLRGDGKHLFNTSLVSRNEGRPHVQKPLGYNKLTMHEMGNQSSRYAEFKRMCNSQKSVRVHWPRDPGAIETCYIFASTSISLHN